MAIIHEDQPTRNILRSIPALQKSGRSKQPVCQGASAAQSHSPLANLSTQYEIFDASQPIPYASKTCYGRLQKVISVTFSQGYEDVCLNKGTTLVFALFHPCILTRGDPRLDRLNIHFYEREDENILHVADITRVYNLVGRVKDGPNSWAIIDCGNRVSRVAYLTHEDGDEGN